MLLFEVKLASPNLGLYIFNMYIYIHILECVCVYSTICYIYSLHLYIYIRRDIYIYTHSAKVKLQPARSSNPSNPSHPTLPDQQSQPGVSRPPRNSCKSCGLGLCRERECGRLSRDFEFSRLLVFAAVPIGHLPLTQPFFFTPDQLWLQ